MDRDELAQRIAAALVTILKAVGVKPAALADDLGISQSTMYRILGGEQLPAIDQLRQIEVHIGVIPGTTQRRAGTSEPPGWTYAECVALHPGLDEISQVSLQRHFERELLATVQRRSYEMISATEDMLTVVEDG